MSNLRYEIKFKNLEQFKVLNNVEFKQISLDEFLECYIQAKNHIIYIIMVKNNIELLSFSGDKITYGYDQNEKLKKYNNKYKKE